MPFDRESLRQPFFRPYSDAEERMTLADHDISMTCGQTATPTGSTKLRETTFGLLEKHCGPDHYASFYFSACKQLVLKYFIEYRIISVCSEMLSTLGHAHYRETDPFSLV